MTEISTVANTSDATMTVSDQEEDKDAPLEQQQQGGETTNEASSSSSSTPNEDSSESSPSPKDQILQDYYIEHYLFPSKLWRILDDAEKFGYADVISWVDNGTAFQIHDREKVIPILKKRFHVSKYKSFLRQLQAYKFRREAPNKGDSSNGNGGRGKWKHELFRRDKANWCTKIKREETNKSRKANASGSSSSASTTTGIAKAEAVVAPAGARASLDHLQQHIHPAARIHQHPLFGKYSETGLSTLAPALPAQLPPALAWNRLASNVLRQRRPSSMALDEGGSAIDPTTPSDSYAPKDPYAEELALLERRKQIILTHRRLQQDQKAQQQQQEEQQQQQEHLQKQEEARKRVLLAHQRVLKEAQLCRDLELKKIDFAMLCAKMRDQQGDHRQDAQPQQQRKGEVLKQLPGRPAAPLRDHKSELLKRESQLIRALKSRQQLSTRGISSLSSLTKLPTTSLPSSSSSGSETAAGMVLRDPELTRAGLQSQQLALQQRQRQRQIVSSALDVVTGVATDSSDTTAPAKSNEPSQLVASALDVINGVSSSVPKKGPSQLVSSALDVINGVSSSSATRTDDSFQSQPSKRNVRTVAPRSSAVTGVISSVTAKKKGLSSKRTYSKKKRGIAMKSRAPRKRWLSSATMTDSVSSTTPFKNNLGGSSGLVRATRGPNIASLFHDLDKAFQPATSSSRFTGMLPVAVSPEQRQQRLRLLASRTNAGGDSSCSNSAAESQITREEMLDAAVAERLERLREATALASMRNTGVASSLLAGRRAGGHQSAAERGGEVSDDSTEGSTTPTISNKSGGGALEGGDDDEIPGALEQFAATAMLGLAR